MTLQKVGGIAALIEALAYIIGFVVMGTILNPGNTDGWSQAQKLSFILDKHIIFQSWILFIYVIFGLVLAVALHERLQGDAKSNDRGSDSALMPIATVFGFIWAGLVIASGMITSIGLDTVAKLYAMDIEQAVALWAAIGVVQQGLGGGVEIVGGLWVLLISVAVLRSCALPRLLGYLGMVVGVAGILTLAPPLSDLGAIFGLGQIVWFSWIGILMLRSAGV
ncbi:DUF4386 family protein [Shewanella sp. SNU WT4]|uniref:DUF4386 family protein n=1 Tax=Shewanella sp. SNU WT4 TaxID=2590015 RepID=UPI00112B39C1|nr:DUF4386 family protein [Shewanella sp. SNU WT4]QDF67232.1 DUF4386 family protein [Shewanella sp. SNU WT4]